MRLDQQFRCALYAVFSVLFVSGAGWLVADHLKEDAEAWQQTAAYLLMIHGGATMVVLLLLGALFPLHMRRGWRARKNRMTGAVMITFNAILIVTAFGLYYSGSDVIRLLTGRIHYGFGFALPILVLIHIVLGRRAAAETRPEPSGDDHAG